MSNPYESPAAKNNPFADQPLSGLPNPSASGMVNQVQVVCILMIVQGALTLLVGLMLAGYGILFPTMIAMEANAPGRRAPQPPQEMLWVIFGVMLAIGVVALLSAILQIYAGIKNLSFRGHTLGLIALFSVLPACLTIYCAPTGIGLMIYGLIVYFNADVKHAFKMGDQGATRQQILAAFWPHRPPTPQNVPGSPTNPHF